MESDPGYHPYVYDVKVFVDEREVHGAVTADEALGLVIVHERDPDGRFKFDRAAGRLVDKEIRGVVRLELPPHLMHLRSKQVAKGCRVHPAGPPSLYR